MLNLLNFAEETSGEKGGVDATQIVMWVVLGLLIVGMIVWMIFSQKKQKKRAAEMMSQLTVGSIVTTIGGIVGEVIQLDDKHIWLATGIDENRTTMQFLRQAIHSIAPAPGSPEAEAIEKAEKKVENEEDEIK